MGKQSITKQLGGIKEKEQWQSLIGKNSNDTVISTLNALRSGFCAKADRVGIALDWATEIF